MYIWSFMHSYIHIYVQTNTHIYISIFEADICIIIIGKYTIFSIRLLNFWQRILIHFTIDLHNLHIKGTTDPTGITRYVDSTPTSEVTPVTIRYIRPSHHGHTSQYHGHEWMTHILFTVNRPPHFWDRAISDSDLETQRSRSWVWSKGKVIQSAQYHINSLPFHLTSIRPTIPEIELFRNLTLKHPRSRSWVRSKVNVTYFTQYPTNALPFCFTSIRPTIPEIWPKECLTLKKHILNF